MGRTRHFVAMQVPDLPLPVLADEVDAVLDHDLVHPHALAVDHQVLDVHEVGRLLRRLGIGQPGFHARHHEQALGGLPIGRHLDQRRGEVVEDQLARRIGPLRVIAGDRFPGSIDPVVRILRAYAGRALLRPERNDLGIVKGVVQIHVAREQVLDIPPVARRLGRGPELRDFSPERGDLGRNVVLGQHRRCQSQSGRTDRQHALAQVMNCHVALPLAAPVAARLRARCCPVPKQVC